jgi:hypothetical protein
MLFYTRPEAKTITAVYKATPRQMIADVNGVAHRFEDRLWGLIQELTADGLTNPQQFVGVQLVPKQDNLHQWRYVAIRGANRPRHLW